MTTEEEAKTIATAEMAVQQNPVNSRSHVELGMAYFHAERFDEAMSAFQKALALDPHDPVAYNWLGRVYYHTGPSQSAIEAYQRAIDLDPHYVDAYYGLGILCSAQLGDYEAAMKAFEDGIKHNPTESFLVASLGSTYARMGQFEQAIAYLQQSIDLQQENAFAYSWLSMIYLCLGRYGDAIAASQAEIEIEDSHSARRMLGYAYERLGRYDESMTALERALTLEPQDYEARGALVRVYRALNRQSDVDRHYEIARERASQDDEYGQACFEAVIGNTGRAVQLLEAALKKGQVQTGWVRIDPEFVFIREDAAFQALLKSG